VTLTSNNLRQVRRNALLTQAELAALSGVSPATIASIESNRRSGWRSWRKLAGALGVPVEEIRPKYA
jgi:DNA-binding XRE family transcriptional regulator